MQFPEFDTQRLKLTMLNKRDAEAIFKLFSDDLVVEYYDLEAFTDLSQAVKILHTFEARYKNKLGIRWAIRLKDTNHLIGTCGLNAWSPAMKSAVIGYDLLPEFWGRGYMTEAVRRVIKAAFSGELSCGELNRIQADTVPGNNASESVLRRVGFKEEGLRRQSGYWKNRFHDLKCFGLIRSEFHER